MKNEENRGVLKRFVLFVLFITLACSASFAFNLRKGRLEQPLVVGHEKQDSLLTLSAKVVDRETGLYMPYVNVYASNGNGTLTNAEGDFTLRTTAGSSISLSYVGYEKVTVSADRVGKVIKMKPLNQMLGEVVVVPPQHVTNKVEAKLAKEYRKRQKNSSVFFYRQFTTTRNKDLVEAFVEAKNAVNLRDISVITGQHGRQTAAGLARPLIADMNFHHPLELGPMTEGVKFWTTITRPMFATSSDWSEGRKTLYDYSLETLYDSLDNVTYAVTFTPKDTLNKRIILTGTMYVDGKTYNLLSFDGKLEGMQLDTRKDFIQVQTPIDLSMHINYSHTDNYTEVENISYTLSSGGMTTNALLYNVDGLDVSESKVLKKKRMKENMLAELSDEDFAAIMKQNADIVQRTEDETEATERDNNDVFATYYNIKSNGAPMKWELHLPDDKLGNLTNRLAKMGQLIPQEKVYVHMDNTSYFMGDTIWYSVYLRRTSDDMPSNVSGIVYVELLNDDGFLMERQIVDVYSGSGHGQFVLNRDWYSGFYELRAYTRWQLNWGVYEREHSEESKDWFINKQLEQRYFRDYEKLYSRVFPVYDHPKREGVYAENMTLRDLGRYYTKDPDPAKLQVKLYPEGGELIEGVPCRVAFEASYTDGLYCDGILTPSFLIDEAKKTAKADAKAQSGKSGKSAAKADTPSAPTLGAKVKSRGRGVIEFTPTSDMDLGVEFTATNGTKVKAKLPKPQPDGVALRVERIDSLWHITARAQGTARTDTLGVTIMHEGRVRQFYALTDSTEHFTINNADLESGVNQATVFDTNGRIFADRLFFVTHPDLSTQSLTISGLKSEYRPYEHVTLKLSVDTTIVNGIRRPGVDKLGNISIAVRDKNTTNALFDNASMMAEMLLSSEIQGFVPSPDWFFEKDDAEHRTALDLLMLTQGWRRFDWRSMAVRGAWDITQPDERTPIVMGDVHTYYPGWFYHPRDYVFDAIEEQKSLDEATLKYLSEVYSKRVGWSGDEGVISTWMHYKNEQEVETKSKSSSNLSSTVRMHAELVPLETTQTAVVESSLTNGRFRISLPKMYGESVLFVAASDTAKWKKGHKYTWIQKMEDTDAKRKFRSGDGEFSLRIDWPYPRFVKPYTYFQNRVNYLDDRLQEARILEDGTHQLREVYVRGERRGFRALVDTLPAFIVDAYDAYNFALDAGMRTSQAERIARAYVGDYGLEKPYRHSDTQKLYGISSIRGADALRRSFAELTSNPDSASLRRNLLNDRTDNYNWEYEFRNTYGNLFKIDKYVIYTDYQPRHIGSSRYAGSNLPRTTIAVYPYPDESIRMFYRDRRFVLPGLAVPAEFYHEDYSHRPLPERPTDYRRTLYWNPNLTLDADGRASISFWNNCNALHIEVSAEGVAADGHILSGRGDENK